MKYSLVLWIINEVGLFYSFLLISIARTVIFGSALRTKFMEYSHSYLLMTLLHMSEAAAQDAPRCV